MNKTNTDKIKEYYEKLGYSVEWCDIGIEKISQVEFKKVLANLWTDSTDLITKVRGKYHIVEIDILVDEMEVYVRFRTFQNYLNEYGELTLIELLEKYGLDELYENNELKY